MVAKRAPTRQELADILEEVFRRVLDDGERTRAMRPSDPPPWAPYPQFDPQYENVDPENWDRVPYPPAQWQDDWRWAVIMNAQEDVAHLVDDALDLRDLDMPRNRPEWRMLCRLALITALSFSASLLAFRFCPVNCEIRTELQFRPIGAPPCALMLN